jgi:hypothetical protein
MRTINQKEEESVWKVFGEYVTAGFATLWVYGGWEAVSAQSFSSALLIFNTRRR